MPWNESTKMDEKLKFVGLTDKIDMRAVMDSY